MRVRINGGDWVVVDSVEVQMNTQVWDEFGGEGEGEGDEDGADVEVDLTYAFRSTNNEDVVNIKVENSDEVFYEGNNTSEEVAAELVEWD